MMRRATALALAAALLGGLFAIPAVPAGAQNGDSMLDAPRLGFEIDPKAGNVGDTVAAQVNPADVQEHCYTTVDEMREGIGRWGTAISGEPSETRPDIPQTQWQAIVEGLYPGLAPDDPQAIVQDFLGPSLGPFWDVFYPPPPAPNYPTWFGEGPTQDWFFYRVWVWNNHRRMDAPVEKTPEEYLAGYVSHVMTHVWQNTAGVADLLFPQTSIVTFVDPVTQEMSGEMGNFDPATGAGQIEVPDLDPGLWAVAAACIELEITEESVVSAISALVELFDAHDAFPEGSAQGPNWDFCAEPWGQVSPDLDDCEMFWLEPVLTTLIAELAVPRALGIDFYCILNADGFCATPPDPVGLLAELSDEELAEFAGLEAGDSTGDGDAGPAGLSAEPVSAAPAFTG